MATVEELESRVETLEKIIAGMPKSAFPRNRPARTGRPGIERKIKLIQAHVAAHFDLSVDRMLMTVRYHYVSWPRMVAMYLARTMTSAGVQDVGAVFHRHHGTVINATKTVCARIDTDSLVAAEITQIREQLEEILNPKTANQS